MEKNKKSIELIVINDHTELDENREYETCIFSDDKPISELKDIGKKISVKERELLDMDSDIYFLNPKDYKLRIADNARIYFENAPEDTEVILLTWEFIYHNNLGAQSLIARFYGPKMENLF